MACDVVRLNYEWTDLESIIPLEQEGLELARTAKANVIASRNVKMRAIISSSPDGVHERWVEEDRTCIIIGRDPFVTKAFSSGPLILHLPALAGLQ